MRPRKTTRLTQEVAQLRVQSLQQDAELEELLLHGLLRLFKILMLQEEEEYKIRLN